MAEPQRLQNFKAQLAEKLERAQGADVSAAKLGFVAGGHYWLVNLDQVNEVITVPELTAAPWVQDWFVGVASVRGLLYGCTDLAAFLKLAEPMPPGESRLLLVHPRFGINAALRIERALGLRVVSDLTAVAMPAASPTALPTAVADWEISRWRDAEGHYWREISLQKLVALPEFLEVGV